MTLPLLLLSALLAALFAKLCWRAASLALWLLTLAAFVLTGSGVLANLMLEDLQDGYETSADDGWGNRNAIVVLGAGSVHTDRGAEPGLFSYGRLVKALEIYRSCKARASDCRIVSSGGDTNGYGISEAELYAARLEQMGVPHADLLIEKRSMNTWQNAQFTAPILAAQEFDHVVLVTSGAHLSRSVLYFSHFGIRPQPVRGDYALVPLSVLPRAYGFTLTDIALHEYIGVLRYHVYNALGWNVQATQPGAV